MGKTRTVVIIEDSDEDYAAMMWAWRKAGITNPVVRCKDGEEALDLMFRRGADALTAPFKAPGLILLDLNMPRTDGRAVLAAIKGDEKLRAIPVVVLTTSASPTDVSVCYSKGANSYILKPVSLTGFMEILKQVVSYWTEIVYLPQPN